MCEWVGARAIPRFFYSDLASITMAGVEGVVEVTEAEEDEPTRPRGGAEPARYSTIFDNDHIVAIAENPTVSSYENDSPVINVKNLSLELLSVTARYHIKKDVPIVPADYIEEDKLSSVVDKEKTFVVEMVYKGKTNNRPERVVFTGEVNSVGVAKKIAFMRNGAPLSEYIRIPTHPVGLRLEFEDVETKRKCEALHESAIAVATIFQRGYRYFTSSIVANGTYTDEYDTITANRIKKKLPSDFTEDDVFNVINTLLGKSKTFADEIVNDPSKLNDLFGTPDRPNRLNNNSISAYAVYVFRSIKEYDENATLNMTFYRLSKFFERREAVNILRDFRAAFVEFMKSESVHAIMSYMYTNVIPLTKSGSAPFTVRTADFAHRADVPAPPPPPPAAPPGGGPGSAIQPRLDFSNSRIHFKKIVQTAEIPTTDGISVLGLAAAIRGALYVNATQVTKVVDGVEIPQFTRTADGVEVPRLWNIETGRFGVEAGSPGITEVLKRAFSLPDSFAVQFKEDGDFLKKLRAIVAFETSCQELFAAVQRAINLDIGFDIKSIKGRIDIEDVKKAIDEMKKEIELLTKEILYSDESVIDLDANDARNIVDFLPFGEVDILQHFETIRTKFIIPIYKARGEAGRFLLKRKDDNAAEIKKQREDPTYVIPKLRPLNDSYQ